MKLSTFSSLALLSAIAAAFAPLDPRCATVTSTKTIWHKTTLTVTATNTDCKTTTPTHHHHHHKTTSTPVPTNACILTKPIDCSPSGFKLDYYANPFAGYGYPPSGLGPNYYIAKKLKPLGSGIANLTYFPQNMDPTGYPIVYPGTSFDNGDAPYYVGWQRTISGVTVDANNFTLVYRGLYKAPATGNFSICGDADNIIDIFFGAAGGAFPCGGPPSVKSKPLVSGTVSTGGNYNNPTTCFTENLIEGFFYPIRFVMANFQGPSAEGFTITAPGGSANDLFNDSVYAPSCALPK